MKQLLADNWLSLLVLAALGLALVAFRTSPSELGSLDELRQTIGGGQPVVVYIYSNT